MIKTLAKYRTYRDIIDRPGVRSIGFAEWLLGRISGRLLVAATTMAFKRGDKDTISASLLAVWAGNQSNGSNVPEGVTPSELSRAMKEGRVRVVIDQ